MRRLLVLLLFLLVGFSSADAWTPDQAARAAGLPADASLTFVVDDDPDALDGGFIRPETYCSWFICQTIEQPTISVRAGRRVPHEAVLAVLLHEIGHYHQWKTGVRESMSVVDREWAADAYAVQALCQLGLDGPAVSNSIFTWVYVVFGYTGDDNHGTLADRMDAAGRAGCRGVSQEAA